LGFHALSCVRRLGGRNTAPSPMVLAGDSAG
jgi:hypothetical protein